MDGGPGLGLSRQAYDAIKSAIVQQGLAPGSLLSQKDLAAEYGVSLTPVREALIRLEQEGFVRILAKKGALIAEVSVDDLEDVLAVRAALEGAAAQAAATHIPAEALGAIRAKMDEAETKHDAETLYELGGQLHELILEHCRFPRLVTLLSGIGDHIARYSVLASRLPDQVERSAHGHRAILEALARGDGLAARWAVEAHIRQMKTELQRALLLRPASRASAGPQATTEGN